MSIINNMETDNKLSNQISPKNADPITLFEKDPNFVFVYKKTEKLATAVYMVTGLFSDNEPMKWSLRRKVSELMSFNLTYKDIAGSSQIDFNHSVQTRVLEIVSLLDISERAGLISTMNFSILKQEFSGLLDTFNSFEKALKDLPQETLSKTFFDTQLQSPISSSGSTNVPAALQGSLKVNQSHLKDNTSASSSDNQKRSSRQNIILNMLKKKKEVTIKDITEVIKNCSEKTIQRELISFIAAGVLKKTGERRWSKYSLAIGQ